MSRRRCCPTLGATVLLTTDRSMQWNYPDWFHRNTPKKDETNLFNRMNEYMNDFCCPFALFHYLIYFDSFQIKNHLPREKHPFSFQRRGEPPLSSTAPLNACSPLSNRQRGGLCLAPASLQHSALVCRQGLQPSAQTRLSFRIGMTITRAFCCVSFRRRNAFKISLRVSLNKRVIGSQ